MALAPNKGWDEEQLRQNMVNQLDSFPQHKLGATDDPWTGYVQDMKDHCTIGQSCNRNRKRHLAVLTGFLHGEDLRIKVS